MRIIVFIFLLFSSLLFINKSYAQKIDTIYHTNGNILTGDLKKFNYGVFTWKMDGMGTISLEEPKVLTIRSPKKFEIKLKNGMLYFASLDTSNKNDHVKLVFENGIELVSIDDIVEIYPIRKNFWLRTSGNFSLGLNYSKGSDLATISFVGNLNYKKRKSEFYLNWDIYNTFQADTLSSTKTDANLGWQRQLKSNWSLGTVFGLAQNSELGTKLRLDFTFTGIRDIVYNNWNRLFAAAGISVQRETPYDTASNITNDIAGVVGITWKVYKYTNPKVWVDSDISFVPYFTNQGRYRTNINISPQVSVIGNDLKIGFRVYYTYDSKPNSTIADSDDWGINLELTYSLH